MSDVDPNAIFVIACLVLLHLAITALPLGVIYRARGRQLPPESSYAPTVITSLTPAVLVTLMLLFSTRSGPDGMGGMSQGLAVIGMIPLSWFVLVMIAIKHALYKPPSEW